MWNRARKRSGPAHEVLCLSLVALLAVAGCSGKRQAIGTTPSPTAAMPADYEGPAGSGQTRQVKKVVDGDTVILDGSESTRLLGIDTPETVHPQKPVECFGPEASGRLKSLLPEGTQVEIFRDAQLRDQYGRLLAYVVRTEPREFINATLVAEGYARTLQIKPNDGFSSLFSRLANDAQNAGRGLWSACETTPG